MAITKIHPIKSTLNLAISYIVNGEKTDFTYLKGYQKGPVFSVVWGDYTKDRNQFNSLARSTYMKNKKN